MGRARLSMRKIRDVLRLRQAGLSTREIGRACAIGKETVREYLGRAAEAGLGWPLPEGMTEEQVEARLFPFEVQLGRRRSRLRPMSLSRSCSRRPRGAGSIFDYS